MDDKNKSNNPLKGDDNKEVNTKKVSCYQPNGKLIFTCDEEKANWYVYVGLAERISDVKIKLIHSPQGPAFD